MMIKLLIVDDHPIVRRGTKDILEEASDIVVTDEACNGAEALSKVSKNEFDVVLLDLSLPGRSGLDVLADLKSIKPDLEVLILSMYPEKQFAIRALKTGASGYLTKASAPFELTKAIRTISKGEKYISSSMAQILASYLEDNTGKYPHETLSNREYQVMCMISSGKTIKEIADELSLSIKSISTYRTRILEKMKMKNDVELTHYVIKNNLSD